MRRLFDIEKMENVTVSMIDKIKIIKETKEELIANIQQISECYRGVDAEIIELKYLEEANKLDIYIHTIDSYIQYFKWLVNNYGDNFNNTKKNFSEISNEIKFYKNPINDNTIINNTDVLNINYKTYGDE